MRIKLDSSSLKILVCCHKPCVLPEDPDGIFLPVLGGAALLDSADADGQPAKWRWGGARDDLLNGEPCDSISGKNKSFCELTAVYWAWKNVKRPYPDLEYIGVNHYRRYFSFGRNIPFSRTVNGPAAAARDYKPDLGKLESILSSHDAVLAKRGIAPHSVSTSFSSSLVNYADLRVLRRIVHAKYPDYDRAMYDVMFCRNGYSSCNMCVMRWRDFDAYCAWLFDVLFECERQIDISAYDAQQRRVFGYMSEILLNVWAVHNGLKAKCLPILWLAGKPGSPPLRDALQRARCSLAFLFARPWRKFSPERYAEMLKHCEDALERIK